ncbi:hypothetical protein BB8028_0002g13870 [Beauveria bassiana]|uniref:Uncharacterized protein n=1 Tax=Beauveria bassiana TaxID=176275 RepID=A0A2S7Y4T4_BEABA|nr:hypothetical protein BB8028_0002g13870 [Beauveria bassiana]
MQPIPKTCSHSSTRGQKTRKTKGTTQTEALGGGFSASVRVKSKPGGSMAALIPPIHLHTRERAKQPWLAFGLQLGSLAEWEWVSAWYLCQGGGGGGTCS